ncbi:uncharacterized protein LOC111687899 [Lucilia cuprina]|uniref:uncharacterized protein LOC111687899 n=1 Tax=Lucilia cuprina TaxID=7375 RepID=UPI001F070D6C|nr:uncharacterized protein LOC111687899 [Lucilia cuprina]
MYFSILLSLLITQIYIEVAATSEIANGKDEQCPYENTVNLTNHQKYENGSYLYEGIIIPIEKQKLYDYHLEFMHKRTTVPLHLRGCVCEKQPCMKLCCEKDEYFSDKGDLSKCEKLASDMKIDWKLLIYGDNGTTNMFNIFDHFTIQVGLPCQRPKALDKNMDLWNLKENGILNISSDNSLLDTLNYCYSPHLDNDTAEYVLVPFSCPIINNATWRIYLNSYGMVISIIFLIPTILVYLLLKELRGNLSGKLLICYLVSLTVGYTIISFINISHLRFGIASCRILGFTCYFFFMAAFLWLSVLCFDIWMNFNDTSIELNYDNNCQQFILYSLFVWSGAALATICAICIELSPNVDDIYKPGIGVEMCWLNTEKWSASIYFYGPNLVILIFNIVTFTHITVKIYQIRRDMARMTHKEKFLNENAIVILRLFLIMGISWLFDIISYCVREHENLDIAFVLSDFINAIQGCLIFSLFVLKPKILKLIKKRPKSICREVVFTMNLFIFLILLTWQIYIGLPWTFAQDEENNEEICPYQNTVNLTNLEKYENGSYLYEDILIPPEKQNFYDYHLKFLRKRVSVPRHLRGCVCENKPCIKLCCEKDEYLNDKGNTSKCEKITSEMTVQWILPLLGEYDKVETANILEHFTLQVGLPCREPEALDKTLDEWILKKNGSLYISSDGSELDTLDYCYSPHLDEDSNEYILTPFSCPILNIGSWQLYLNTYAMTISVVFLIPTILVYLVLKELRGNLRGKLLISYLISLTVGYTIITFINISSLKFDIIPCSILGFTCYFFFMAAFLWLGVLCFDIWRNFGETSIELNSAKNQLQFIYYSLFAWLGAGLATFCAICIELSTTVDEIYKPGIGVEMCWLNTEKWSAAIYFYGPNLVILIFNFVTFSHITTKIYKVRRDVARMTHKEKFFQENAIVILRLFLIMGISWLFDIISYCVREYENWEIVFVFSDFANAIQGILIFSLFVLKPKILKLLKKRFFENQDQRRSGCTYSSNFSKLPTSS